MTDARSVLLSFSVALGACGGPMPAPHATVAGTFGIADAALLDLDLPIGGGSSLVDGNVTGTCVLTDSAAGRALTAHLDDNLTSGPGDELLSADVTVAAGADVASVTVEALVSDTTLTFSNGACPITFASTAGSSGATVASVGACTLTTTSAGGFDVSSTFDLVLTGCEVR